MDLNCPQCRKDDRVEKVTTVTKVQTQYGDLAGTFGATGDLDLGSYTWASQPWEQGITTWTRGIIGFSGEMQLSGVTSSALSRSLAPPVRPVLSLPSRPLRVRDVDDAVKSRLRLLFPGFLVFFIGGIAMGGYWEDTSHFSLVLATIGWVSALLSPFVTIFLAIRLRREMRRRDSANLAEWERTCGSTKQQYANDLVRWEVAAQVWDNLFYCYRCDVAFLPDGQSKPIRPELVSPFITHPSSAEAIGISLSPPASFK